MGQISGRDAIEAFWYCYFLTRSSFVWKT